jgi:hypothetical protein
MVIDATSLFVFLPLDRSCGIWRRPQSSSLLCSGLSNEYSRNRERAVSQRQRQRREAPRRRSEHHLRAAPRIEL